jgi:glutathione S-transferase
MRPSTTRIALRDDIRIVNPKMQVPVIWIDGIIITEVPAVATAISNLAPELGLMGKTPMDTARVYEWMNWLSGTLHGGGFGHLFRPQRWSDDPAAFDGIKTKAVETIEATFYSIDEKLSLSSVHAVGNTLTIVDTYLFVFYRWGNNDIGFEMKAKYPKYTALVSNLVQRASVKAALNLEQIDSTL